MQLLHPMQISGLKSTIPSLREYMALVGQIFTHGAFSHWLQRSTAKWRLTSGKTPFSTFLTQVRKLPSGTSFSDLHATEHAWHPMQRSWSMTLPQRIEPPRRRG